MRWITTLAGSPSTVESRRTTSRLSATSVGYDGLAWRFTTKASLVS
ncbi:MAG: hypothetical protein ACLTEX_02745 [Eggerthella lenta]